MRVAVTGAGGRLGSALRDALGGSSFVTDVLAWDIPEHNLDDPASAERLVGRDRPDVVIHAAAWTDVDGCARDPQLAMRRNGTAVGEMAQACVGHGAALVTISTNEVFDGRRTDGQPYGPIDVANPANPYGAAKLAASRPRGPPSGRPETTSPAPRSRPRAGASRRSRLWRSFEPPGSSGRPAATSR